MCALEPAQLPDLGCGVCVFISCFLVQIHVIHMEDVRLICLFVYMYIYFFSHSLMERLCLGGGQMEVLSSFTESCS